MRSVAFSHPVVGVFSADVTKLLSPVFFQLWGWFEDWRVDGDDFQFGTAGATVDDLSYFQIVV